MPGVVGRSGIDSEKSVDVQGPDECLFVERPVPEPDQIPVVEVVLIGPASQAGDGVDVEVEYSSFVQVSANSGGRPPGIERGPQGADHKER